MVKLDPVPDGRERRAAPAVHKPHTIDGLRVIALFKFVKAALLIATDYGVHLLLNQDLLERLQLWTASLTDSFAQRMMWRALDWVEGLGATRIHVVLGVTVGYTAVVLVEGVGLWMRLAWAEWLTVLATASLIPFEFWELATRPRKLAVIVTLAINVTVVWYLAWLLRQAAATHRRPA
jgi:uncharacterized membrane protein (DUF2068 family)